MLTVTSLKEMYQGIIAPNNDVEFLRILQESEIRLLETGRWMWCRARVTLTAASGVITLGSAYASIIGAQVDGYPTSIHSPDFEFTPDGPGEIEVMGGFGLLLIDQGLDDSQQRTYKLTGCSDSDTPTIVALCGKAPATLYDPEISDSDLPDDATINLTCPDAGAYKLAMLGIIFEEKHDLGASRGYFGTAYTRLNEREKTRRGNAQQVPNVRPQGRGVRRIRNLK